MTPIEGLVWAVAFAVGCWGVAQIFGGLATIFIARKRL